MIALAGDAELDEGNIFEALLEGWKHDVRNLWWVIDYNRQSLDAVVSDRLFGRIDAMFEMMGWRVVTLKYGRLLEAAFARPGRRIICASGSTPAPTRSIRRWSTRAARAGASISTATSTAIPGSARSSTTMTTRRCTRLMTNLAGHDMETVLDAFHAVDDDRPTCFIAYTIKGYGLPFAGHKDNHAGLMNPEQMALFQQQHGGGGGRRMGAFRRARPAARSSSPRSSRECRSPGRAARRHEAPRDRGAAEPAGAARARSCRPRKRSAGYWATSPPATARSPTGS